jgi:hypothetical protein
MSQVLADFVAEVVGERSGAASGVEAMRRLPVAPVGSADF